MIIVCYFILGIIGGMILMLNYEKNIYFNSNAYDIAVTDNHLSEFYVVAIEESEDIYHHPIAKYTVRNYFFAKKNHKDFKYQTFYFYDRADKYVVGQRLTLK